MQDMLHNACNKSIVGMGDGLIRVQVERLIPNPLENPRPEFDFIGKSKTKCLHFKSSNKNGLKL
jgi:hypothetical protein